MFIIRSCYFSETKFLREWDLGKWQKDSSPRITLKEDKISRWKFQVGGVKAREQSTQMWGKAHVGEELSTFQGGHLLHLQWTVIKLSYHRSKVKFHGGPHIRCVFFLSCLPSTFYKQHINLDNQTPTNSFGPFYINSKKFLHISANPFPIYVFQCFSSHRK